jgi:2-methylcitrate dehydratase
MADATSTAIAERCFRLDATSIPDVALEDARLRVIDALGCLSGGWASPPARIAQTLARRDSSSCGARVLGTDIVTTVEAAGFANGIATRYLDYNDTYMGVTAGHPSDMIPFLLSLAESRNANGADFLASVVTGYEAFGVIAKELSVRARGWDQGLLIGIGTAMGAARLLDLDVERTEEALNLVVTMNVPTRSTRAGELSMWKGAATASSARLGLFSAFLAAEGMTGPTEAFEGKDGLWAQVTGPFQVRPFGPPDPWIVSESAIKFFPAEFNGQAPLELMFELRDRVVVDDIDAIDVWTYWSSYDEIGNEPQKWNPQSRETADHSLPYLLAVGLREGTITEQSFDDEHLADQDTRTLMTKIAVHEDPAFTQAWPDKLKTRLRISQRGGGVVQLESDFPRGHPRRRPAVVDMEAKFMRLATANMGEADARVALDVLGGLAVLADVTELVDRFCPETHGEDGRV